MWEIVGHRWYMEDNVPTLYVSYPGKLPMHILAGVLHNTNLIIIYGILILLMHTWLLS